MSEAELKLGDSMFVGRAGYAAWMVWNVKWDEDVAGPAPSLEIPDADETFLLILRDETGEIVSVDYDFNVGWTGDKDRALRALGILEASQKQVAA